MPTPDQETLDRLTTKRAALKQAATDLLERRQAAGIEELTGADEVRFRSMTADLNGLDERIAEYRSELARVGSYPAALRGLSELGGTERRHGRLGSAARLSPMNFDPEELRSAHARLGRGETVTLEARDFTSGDSLLPAQLYPIPTFPRHESRLLDRLVGFALDAPSLEYVQVTTVGGAAAIVGEGQVKPELTMPATKQIVAALKLACHAGVSWENISDYSAFTTAVQQELLKRVVDLENQQLVYGTGGTTQLSGMVSTPGILTLAATGTQENFSDIAAAIAALRTGPALCEPDLILLNPNTFATIRTQKDDMGRFYVSPDPSQDQVETIFGCDVLQSTEFVAGEAVLLDSQLMGKVVVREALLLRVGYGVVGGQSDFVSNILRWICEERLNLAVERPAAILHLTGLPAVAPTGTKAAAKK